LCPKFHPGSHATSVAKELVAITSQPVSTEFQETDRQQHLLGITVSLLVCQIRTRSRYEHGPLVEHIGGIAITPSSICVTLRGNEEISCYCSVLSRGTAWLATRARLAIAMNVKCAVVEFIWTLCFSAVSYQLEEIEGKVGALHHCTMHSRRGPELRTIWLCIERDTVKSEYSKLPQC